MTRMFPLNQRRVAQDGDDPLLLPGALVSIGLGTMAAVMGVPSDLTDADSLFQSSVFLTIGILLPVLLQIRTNLISVLRVQNALMLGIFYWLLLDLLQSAFSFDGIGREHVQMAFGLIGAFAAAIWVGASGAGWTLPRAVVSSAIRSFDAGVLGGAIVVAFAAGMLNFFVTSGFSLSVMVGALGLSRWGAPWARGDFGGSEAFLEHLQYFGYIVPSLTVLLGMRLKLWDPRVLSAIAMSGIQVVFLSQSGGRRIIGVVVGAAILTWIITRPRLNFKLVFGSGVALIALLVTMQEMLVSRAVGVSARIEGVNPGIETGGRLRVDDNVLRLTQLISFYPESNDFVLFQPVYHALVLPIPRFFWAGKPTSPGFDLPALLGMRGLSLSCSIIGELYVSYGIWAVVLGGLLLGRLAGMWNKLLKFPASGSPAVLYALGVMAMFTGLRSMQALVQMSYTVLAWIVLSSFLTQRRLVRSGAQRRVPVTESKRRDIAW